VAENQVDSSTPPGGGIVPAQIVSFGFPPPDYGPFLGHRSSGQEEPIPRDCPPDGILRASYVLVV